MFLQQNKNEMAFPCLPCRISIAIIHCMDVQISFCILPFEEESLVSNISTLVDQKHFHNVINYPMLPDFSFYTKSRKYL